MLKLFHKTSHDVVTVNVNSENISIAWFLAKKNNNLFILNKYERFNIEDYFIYDLNIFNSSRFSNYLKSFIAINKLINPFVYISLDSNQIIEQLLDSNDVQEQKDSSFMINLHEIIIDKKKFFYTTKIKHSIIFQYKIFAIQSQINLSKIIPGNIINFQILQFFKPDYLKNITQISDIESCFNNFVDSCDIQNYMMISNSQINIEYEKKYLMKNLGIFLLKKFS